MEKTTNYDQFKQVTSNREVDTKHVKKLARAIQEKNLLHVNPIIVNDKHEIIDGQHRLEAARLLKLPIYYVVDKLIGDADISKLNANAKNWTLVDYINYYTVKKAKGFDVLSKYIAEYPFLRPTTIIQLLSGRESGSNTTNDIRNGRVIVADEPKAKELIALIQKLGNISMAAFDAKCVAALQIVAKHDNFTAERLVSQIEKQPRAFVKCATKKQYIAMLLELFNYQIHDKHRIKI